MHVTTADLWAPAPGDLLRWDVAAAGDGTPAALSLNQRNHLAAAAAGEPAVWLAAAFDVDGSVDVDALTRAWQGLVLRQPSLQLAAVTAGEARRHDPSALSWSVTHLGPTGSPEATRTRLHALLDEGCAPFSYPSFVPLALSRPDRSTVVLGMDHLHCDAYSLTVVVDELASLYAAERGGPPVEIRALEPRDPGSRGDEPASDTADPTLLAAWHDAIEELDFTMPTFPLPIEVAPGERLPQATVVRALADAATTAVVAARARKAGASTYAAVLAALAAAVADLGGPDRLDVLAPVGLRRDDAGLGSVGWRTTTVPLSLAADLSDDGLAAAGAVVKRGTRLAGVPLDEVFASLRKPLVQHRRDVFMVSWIDYRHLPGAAVMRARNAHHISASTLADDVQLWLSRTDDGLAVRARFPETAPARRTVDTLLEAWSARLR